MTQNFLGRPTHKLASSSSPRWLILGALILGIMAIEPSGASAKSCIVADTDSHLDDQRAVAVLASSGRLAAIITTEGIARASEGAGAMRAFLSRSGLAPVPVIVGATALSNPKNIRPDGLSSWRTTAETLNGLMVEPAGPSTPPAADMVMALRDATAGCDDVSLVVTGPWTSFLRYGPDLLERVKLIVAQGRPYPDEIGGEPAGFNCTYDVNACKTAFDLLVGRHLRARDDKKLRANWVDIPGGPDRCGSAEPGVDENGDRKFPFAPSMEWTVDLKKAGGAAAVAGDILAANPKGWEKTSLWDDLAALYVLRPELFATRGGHIEPCMPAKVIKDVLARTMASKPQKD